MLVSLHIASNVFFSAVLCLIDLIISWRITLWRTTIGKTTLIGTTLGNTIIRRATLASTTQKEQFKKNASRRTIQEGQFKKSNSGRTIPRNTTLASTALGEITIQTFVYIGRYQLVPICGYFAK
jgi:hypothetical protein